MGGRRCANDIAGWQFILNSRGQLGYAFNHPLAGGKRDDPITRDALINWCLLAGRCAALLADEAGYWGDYIVRYEAFHWDGVPIKDVGVNETVQCVDPRISVGARWSSVLLREDPVSELARLLWRILWATGLHGHMWPMQEIERRLRERAGGFGLLPSK